MDYTGRCNGCMDLGCGICSPPANKANQLGEATCLKDASFCHSKHFITAADRGGKSVCNVTVIPFAAVVGVLVAIVLCCGGCLGYCCFTLRKQTQLKRLLKAKQQADLALAQQGGAVEGGEPIQGVAVDVTPVQSDDEDPSSAKVARNV